MRQPCQVECPGPEARRNLEQCSVPLVPQGPGYWVGGATSLDAGWRELARVAGQADGWDTVRLWLSWPAGSQIDWLLQQEGPQGEAADWASWWEDARGSVALVLPGVWGVRLLARVAGGGGGAIAGVRASWSRTVAPSVEALPAQAGAVRTTAVIAVGVDTVLQPLRAQGYVSVQAQSVWPAVLRLAEGLTTAAGANAQWLDGGPIAAAAGGFYESFYGGPLAMQAAVAPMTVAIVQR